MSNTGHKCISASIDKDGNPWRYQIAVQWNGEIKRAVIRDGSIEEALEIRRSFEDELGKPRTERHISADQVGFYLATDSHGKQSWVAHFGAVRKYFSRKKYGGAVAMQMAREARRQMVIEAGEERT